MKAQVWKNGKQVTESCPISSHVVMEDSVADLGQIKFDAYYFSKVKLQPLVVFQHMAGAGLMSWFDDCELRLEGGDSVVGLKYVHGRSEVMRGNPSITAILLVKPDKEIPTDRWLSLLPTLYKRFSQLK